MNRSAAISGQPESLRDSLALLVEELTAKLQAGESIDVDAGPVAFSVRGRCAYETTFDYSSDG